MSTQDNSVIEVEVLETENPQQRKFLFSQTLSEEEHHFDTIEATAISPLANKLFGFPWTESVTISGNHVIVEKQEWVEWSVLEAPLSGLLKEHLELKIPVIGRPQQQTTPDEGPKEYQVQWQDTPNPQSVKFQIDKPISKESWEFLSAEDAESSPLVTKLFELPWVAGVFLGTHFITITKQPWVEWDALLEPVTEMLKTQLESGLRAEPIKTEGDILDSDTPVVKQIKQILNDEIRPAVAMDGGDIVFHKYESNTLFLQMKGACAGCPSSTATLKMGIEARLQEVLPEIQEVVSI